MAQECTYKSSVGCADVDGVAVFDADSDGVPDALDTCFDTAAGAEVDAAGCACAQRDGDSDGVDDCEDACPNTTTECDVDTTGCPVLSVGDEQTGGGDGSGIEDSDGSGDDDTVGEPLPDEDGSAVSTARPVCGLFGMLSGFGTLLGLGGLAGRRRARDGWRGDSAFGMRKLIRTAPVRKRLDQCKHGPSLTVGVRITGDLSESLH